MVQQRRRPDDVQTRFTNALSNIQSKMKSPSIKPPKISNDGAQEEGEDVTPLSLRIFIGGINPLNGLTSQMVLDRLPQTGLSNVHLGHTYLHGTVQDAAQRALVQRTLHNCKWKQCKLSVENAKEDFLTRLARERTNETTTSSTKTTASSRPSSHKPPFTDGTIATQSPVVVTAAAIDADTKDSSLETHRHWRVKRRFGAPVVLVDTHPKVVSTWTELRVNRSKKHYQNRAIHLKFKDNDDDNDNAVTTSGQEDLSHEGDEDSDQSASEQGGFEASSQGDSSSQADLSLDPSNRSDQKTTSMPTDTYVWSSSDDESSSSDDDDEDEIVVKRANDAPVSGNGKSSLVQEPECDGEEDSVDDDVTSVSSESEQGSNGSGTRNDSVDNHDVEAIDLGKDMEMNESVLAQLFPDAFPADTTSSKLLEAKNKKKRKAATTMVRYDPTDQSAQAKYELSEDEDDNEQATTTQNTKTSNGDKEGETTAKDYVETNAMDAEETNAMDAEETNAKTTQQATGPPPDAYVYEQGQLESVFKESREQEATLQSQSGAFSFGFDLPALLPDSTTDTATSTVSFPLERQENEPVDALDKDVSQSMEDTTESIGPDTVTAAKRGPTLFDFPSEELLDSLTSKFFYGFDDGKRIAENLEEWRNDPTVRESWLQRRAILTLDWKRKRKAALSQRKERDGKHRMSRPRPRPRSSR
jgi:hypothetical protein